MRYYKSNAVYEAINTQKQQFARLKFVVGDAWQLVYGDNNCIPLVLVYASGVQENILNEPLTSEEKEGFSLLNILGSRANLPVLFVRFNATASAIEEVKFSDASFNFRTVTMSELSQIFQGFGLPVSNTKTAKYLNDATSSAYHNWQRGSLGQALTVSDIDLWKVDSEGNPLKFYELKRSFIALDRWAPYVDDYRNFKLLHAVAVRAKMEFKILYNLRTKNPWHDDATRLSVFSVNFALAPPITFLGIVPFNEIVNL